jgi:hypothetical protein
MARLTLSVDAEVSKRAKRYAKRQGTSVSRLVESYLASLGGPMPDQEVAPILRELRGILRKKLDIEDYRRYLGRKYR